MIGASLFSGCGAADLGYAAAGIEFRYACENNHLAAATYELNMRLAVDRRDVRTVRGQEIIDASGGVPDIVIGSPPCNSFTTIGRRDLESEDAGLYEVAVIRLIEVMSPLFVFENVLGFASGRAYGVQFEPIVRELRRWYRVRTAIVDPTWLGVPQTRKRVFVYGVHRSLGVRPPVLRPTSRLRAAVRDVLPGPARIVAVPARHFGTVREERTWPRSGPFATVTGGGAADRGRTELWIEWPDGRRRGMTVADALALSCFPPDLRFPEGTSVDAAWGMVGRCVPPPVTEAIARQLMPVLARALGAASA